MLRLAVGVALAAAVPAARRRPPRAAHAQCVRALVHATVPGPTVGDALRAATAELEAAGVPEAALSAEYLLARALGGEALTRSGLALRVAEPLDARARDAFAAMCARRLERMPVQYILGDWDFLDLTLRVEPPVLVPRPETEELVLHVLRECAALGTPRPRALDVGCGTGAIGLALLARLPAAEVVAIDPAPHAVQLARRNARELGLDARYTCEQCAIEACGVDGVGIPAADAPRSAPPPPPPTGDAPAAASQLGQLGAFDVIVSNPPYIPQADMSGLEPEVASWEDWGALCGGASGLDVVLHILARAASLLRAPGCELWLEVDPSHPAQIEAWVRAHPRARLRYLETRTDLGGHQRFCRLARER